MQVLFAQASAYADKGLPRTGEKAIGIRCFAQKHNIGAAIALRLPRAIDAFFGQ